MKENHYARLQSYGLQRFAAADARPPALHSDRHGGRAQVRGARLRSSLQPDLAGLSRDRNDPGRRSPPSATAGGFGRPDPVIRSLNFGDHVMSENSDGKGSASRSRRRQPASAPTSQYMIAPAGPG